MFSWRQHSQRDMSPRTRRVFWSGTGFRARELRGEIRAIYTGWKARATSERNQRNRSISQRNNQQSASSEPDPVAAN